MLRIRSLQLDQLCLPAIVVVGVILRCYSALNTSLEFDEGWHLFISKLPLGPLLHEELAFNAHPPLFILLEKLFLSLHHSVLTEHLLSLISSLVALVYLAKLTHKLGFPLWVASVVTLFMALSTNHITLSIEVRQYSLALACILGFLYYLIDYLCCSPPTRARDRMLFQLFFAGAISTHYYSLILLAVVLVIPLLHALWNSEYRRRLRETIRQRSVLLDCLFSSIIFVSVAIYVVTLGNLYPGTHSRLSYLRSFFFLGGESIGHFLSRTATSELMIFTPLARWHEGQLALLSLLEAAVLFSLCARHRKAKTDSVDILKQLFPHYALAGLILALILLALAARYPFGGLASHQSVLLPFVFLWSGAVLFHCVELGTVSKLKTDLAYPIVGLTVALCVWNYAVNFRIPMADEFRFPRETKMAAEEIHNSYVWLSDFSFIALYPEYRTWQLAHARRIGDGRKMDVYRVSKASEADYLIRDSLWHHPPLLSRGYLNQVRSLAQQLGTAELSVFQITMRKWQEIPSGEEYREQLSELARESDLRLTDFRHEGRGVWATFQLTKGQLPEPGPASS